MSFNIRVLKMVGALVISVLSVAAFAASSLDGTKWRVEITPEGAPVPHFIDRIHFGGGNFASAIFERKGFPAVSYADKDGAWGVDQKSDTQGELAWKGELQGDKMTGTLVWKQADGKVVNYALNGAPAVEEPAPEEAAAAAAAEAEGKTSTTKGASGSKSSWGCSKK